MSQMTDHILHNSEPDRESLVAGLERFLGLVVRHTRLDLQYQIQRQDPRAGDVENPEILVVFTGRDQDLLLERNAELLKALEYIALRWLKLPARFHDRVRLECGDYRALHLEELKLSARVAAERVRETRQPFRLNPMPARDRRVIHLVLKDEPGVRTASEGTGDQRQVVIYPAGMK